MVDRERSGRAVGQVFFKLVKVPEASDFSALGGGLSGLGGAASGGRQFSVCGRNYV